MLRIVSALVLVLPLLTFDSAFADETLLQALRAPGNVALMRHAVAPGFNDPPGMRIGDCATQRNLDQEGRAQARRIGAALSARGVYFQRVLSSQWCRCLETAELVAGSKPRELPALNSFFNDRTVAPERVAALKAFMRTLGRDDRVLMVTHQVVIQALTGTSTSSGEIVVVKLSDGGKVELVARGTPE